MITVKTETGRIGIQKESLKFVYLHWVGKRFSLERKWGTLLINETNTELLAPTLFVEWSK